MQIITPGAPKSVDYMVTDYTDPLVGAVAPGLVVTGHLSLASNGPPLDPGTDYTATEIGPASAPYTGTVYRFPIPADSTLTTLASLVGTVIYLCPVVAGNRVDAKDVIPLLVEL